MITPKQAREEYGFQDCTLREDQMTLGMFQEAQGLFKNRFFQIVDYTMPFVFLFLIAAVLAGIRNSGVTPMLVLLFGVMALVFLPNYVRQWEQRTMNSGLCHISKEMGEHFLIVNGVCSRKEKCAHRRFFTAGEDYKIRVLLNNNKYLDDVLVLKELYDHIGEGAAVCVMMADSDLAKQMIGAPKSMSDKITDRKNIPVKEFERLDERRVREIGAAERNALLAEYTAYTEKWNAEFGKKYVAAAAVCFVGGLAFWFLRAEGLTILIWMIAMYAVFTLYTQKKEFREYLKYMRTSPKLYGVDVTVRREEGYDPSMGTEKKSNSAVHFVDKGGLVLWSLRTANDLKRFQAGDRAILVIYDKIMIPVPLKKH